MASILTNNSAMVALQTLQTINSKLEMTQNEISTGKRVASATENSALWAISNVMQSDVSGFEAVKSSLSLGESTVAVARNASESVTDLLGQIKETVVTAQQGNVDRDKLQTDLVSLRDQISGIVSAAQFNGQNLLSNVSTTAGDSTISVLGSLDRTAQGSVNATQISVGKQDLGSGDNTAGTAATNAGGNAAVATGGGTGAAMVIASTSIVAGQTFELDLSAGLAAGADIATTGTVSYVAREGDSVSDVVEQMTARLNYEVSRQGFSDLVSFEKSATAGQIDLVNNSANAITIASADATEDLDGAAADGTIGGGLELLYDLDVSTELGAKAAFAAIDSLTQTAINSAAEFGTSEKRLEIQSDFISKLTDSLKSGIGALTDADMTEASAKLQALQVQQQLGIQSLTIANQAPQNILALFR